MDADGLLRSAQDAGKGTGGNGLRSVGVVGRVLSSGGSVERERGFGNSFWRGSSASVLCQVFLSSGVEIVCRARSRKDECIRAALCHCSSANNYNVPDGEQ